MAQYGPSSLNLSGGLLYANGTNVVSTSVGFKVDVYDANATCLLYEEQHLGQDLSNTNGAFSLQLGSGSSQVNYLENSTSFDTKLFENPGAVAAFTGCASGVTLAPGSSRVVRVSYDLGQGFTTLTPDVPITNTAYAMIADTLQGIGPSGFIQTDGIDLTQANVATIFSNVNFPKLESLLSGSSTQYISATPGSSVSFNGQLLTNIADPTAAQDAATKNYADNDLGGLPITIAGIGPGTGNGKTLVWDQAADAWIAQTAGTVTYVGGGTGILGGNFSTQGTLAVDVGTTANKILQLNSGAQIPAVDGSLLSNVNARRLAAQMVSTVAPSAAGQVLGWNSTTTQWEPQVSSGITALSGDVVASGPGSAASTIQAGAVNLVSKIISQYGGPNQLLITDGTGNNVTYGACTVVGQIYQWTANGWACVTVNALLGNTSVSAGTYGTSSMVPQITVDATGRVTNLTNVNLTYPVTTVNGKTGDVVLNAANLGLGTASTQDYGTAANELVQLNGAAGYPALDGYLITNVDATNLGGKPLSISNLGAGQVLTYNGTLGAWDAETSNTATGFVQGGNSFGTTATLGTNDNNAVQIITNGSTAVTVLSTGDVGIGVASPTSALQIKAGTTSVAPLQLTAGTNLTTPVPGAIEYDGTSLYYTDSASTRHTLAAAGSGLTALTGDVSASGSGSVTATVNKVNGVTYPSSPGLNTVPVIASSGTVTYEAVPNAALANSSLTLGSTSLSLGGTASSLSGLTSIGLGVNGTTTGTLSLATSTASGASVTLQNPSATSAYNFNLPATAGTSGYVLTSAGGGSSPMTWTQVAPAAGSTSITTLGTVTTGTWNGSTIGVTYGGTGQSSALTADGVVYASSTSAMATTGAGSSGQVLTSNGAGSAPTFQSVSASNVTTTQASTNASYYPLFVSSSTNSSQAVDLGTGLSFNPSSNTLNTTNITAGTNATTAGVIGIANGGTNGVTVSIENPSATSAYNFNLPATAGTSGYVLTSAGGGSSPMTWTQVAPAAGSTSITTLGTVTTGTWNASIVPVLYGGTGTSTGSITGTTGLTFTAGGSNQNVTLTPSGSGYTLLNGNVGIGTTSPVNPLVINSSSANAQIDLQSSSTSNSEGIRFINDLANVVYIGANNSASSNTSLGSIPSSAVFRSSAPGGMYITSSDSSASMVFSTGGNATTNERMVINSSGNVGIGTTSPGFPLHVVGVARIDGATGTSGTLQINHGSGSTGAAIQLYPDTNAVGLIGTISAGAPLGFETANSERMRIDGSGNVGIGTSSPAGILDVEGSGTVILNTGYVGIGTTSPVTASEVDGASSTYTGSRANGINLIQASGTTQGLLTGIYSTGAPASSYAWMQSALFGTANSALALQPGGGSIGIGTTSPAYTLDVNGNINASGQITINGVNVGTSTSSYWNQTSSNLYYTIGSVGIGTSLPQESLHVYGGGMEIQANQFTYGTLFYQDAASNTYIGLTNGLNQLFLSNAGSVGIGTTNPNYTLQVNGSVAGTSAYVNTSDQRLKKDIQTIPSALQKIEQVRGVTFNWRHDVRPELHLTNREQMGVIAQEVEKVFPDAVDVDEQGFRSVAYTMLVAPVIEAIKELHHELQSLTSREDRLEKENADLKSKLAEQAARLEALEKKLESK